MTATILIVDDSTFIVEGLTALLRKNYRVLPSFGGDECLAILRTEKPDVIVLDILMEPMDGWETLARIKENPATRHIPVLMFSAKKITFDEAEAHRIWIDDFLIKPVNPRELIIAIEKILEREKQNKNVLHIWTKAGIPRETIDNYLALFSNLEVDLSLLAAMKKQMNHHTTTLDHYEDLVSSVAELENRVEKGRDAIDEFFRRTGLCLPSSSDSPKTGPPVPEQQPVVSVSQKPEPEEEPDHPIVCTGNLPVAGGIPSPAEVPAHLPEPARDMCGLSAGVPDAGVPDDGVHEPASLEQESAKATPHDTDSIGWIHIPSHADSLPIRNSPGIDQFFEPEEAPGTPGADNQIQSSPQAPVLSGGRDPDREKKVVQDARPSIGFFSRIIAAIMALFGRGKK